MKKKTAFYLATTCIGFTAAQLAHAQTAAEVSRTDSDRQDTAPAAYDSLRFDDRPYIAPMLSVLFPGDTNGATIDSSFGGSVSVGKPFTRYVTGEVFANFAGETNIDNSVFEKAGIFQYGVTGMISPIPKRLPVYVLASYGLSQFDFDRVGGRGDEPSETGSFWDVGAGAKLALSDLGVPDPWGVSLRAEYRYRQADVNVELGSSSTADDFDIDGHMLQIGFQIPILPPSG